MVPVFAVTIATSTDPRNVYVVKMRSGGAAKWYNNNDNDYRRPPARSPENRRWDIVRSFGSGRGFAYNPER